MSDSYKVGQTVLIKAYFRDVDENLVDPDTVTITVRAPDGTLTNPPNTNPSVGEYHTAQLLDQAGIWRWRWEGQTGSSMAISEGSVCADKSIVLAA